MSATYRILERKRCGETLRAEEIEEVVRGATEGAWSDAQLAAFLTSAAIHGLSETETEALTLGMLESGEQWDLASEIPGLADKHSTGGVGDKVSILLSPLLASLEVPVMMLSGRALGHTGGTADKLESIPGLQLELDRTRSLELLREVGMAVGIATDRVAPADRRLYALRDQTANIASIPMIVASILSKKLAAGAAGLVFDVKTGNGAFMTELEESRRLARHLVSTTVALGRAASAIITDMSQPLGRWVGHTAEVAEVWRMLEGEPGPDDLRQVTFALCREAARLLGSEVTEADLAETLRSGRARKSFLRWARLQGADPAWLGAPEFPLAPAEHVLTAPRAGRLARVDTRGLGLLMVEAGGGRARAEAGIDYGVSLEVKVRLGDAVESGEELARLYLRREDRPLADRFAACFQVAETAEAPPVVVERITP